MSTIDTSTWSPDADLNVAIEGIPLNSDAGIAQTWFVLRALMAAVKGDGDSIKSFLVPFTGATASADGASGLVPKPEAGDQEKFLKGDGTWGEATDISGNASTATKLETARTISLSGDASGSATFDGSANASIAVTVVDDSHNHVISNVDGLQTALDGKADNSVLWNWQKTPAAQTVSFYPAPQSPLEPVVNFSFTETLPSGGTKSPTSPSTITGVLSVTVTHCESVGVDETAYAINLGGAYYGGSLDVSTGLMTVTWGMNAFDGTENWVLDSTTDGVNTFRLHGTPLQPMGSSSAQTRACTHFSYSSTSVAGTFATRAATPRAFFRMATTDAADATAFKTWIAAQNTNGTPVKLFYTLATPTTVQLTPTQIYSLSQIDPYTPRLNTVYSDQTSVQVGWQRVDIDSILARLAALEALHG